MDPYAHRSAKRPRIEDRENVPIPPLGSFLHPRPYSYQSVPAREAAPPRSKYESKPIAISSLLEQGSSIAHVLNHEPSIGRYDDTQWDQWGNTKEDGPWSFQHYDRGTLGQSGNLGACQARPYQNIPCSSRQADDSQYMTSRAYVGLPHECLPILDRYKAMTTVPQLESQMVDCPDIDRSSAASEVLICFGVIQNLTGICDVLESTPDLDVGVELDSSGRFGSIGQKSLTGTLDTEPGRMIYGLFQEESLKLFAQCIVEPESRPLKQIRKRVLRCTVHVTVYGPHDLFEEIGEWFQEQGHYLQDPTTCPFDVKYCNPHKLSTAELESCPLVSEVVARSTLASELRAISSTPTFLDALNSRDDLSEAATPSAIRATMKKHQKQALAFMLQRERGWMFERGSMDIWETYKADREIFFVNKVSNAYQTEEPPEFRGGIIADTMGLGKTLTMIALIASDRSSSRDWSALEAEKTSNTLGVDATLLIIPSPLLDTWEEQLSEHVFDGHLQWSRHHRKNRVGSIKELHRHHIVLTTYHTVSAEWKAYQGGQESILFSVRWKRLILDEAHVIRNSASGMAHAACALEASARWVVSGTPIQNRLSDLASLLKFIQASPYDDTKQFDKDISSLWKLGEDEEATKRLQFLSACLILRRSKGVIDLPRRTDHFLVVEFPPEERQYYERLKEQAILSIDEAVSGHHGGSRPTMYANALQRIESLRLFSDLGLQYHARHEAQSDHDWSRAAQQTFNFKRGLGPLYCASCTTSLDLIESLLGDATFETGYSQFSNCMKYFCNECVRKANRDNRVIDCGHKPTCAIATVSMSGDVIEETLGVLSAGPAPTPKLSSKVQALIADLNTIPHDTKCVVFSTWRLTLDLVQAGLDQNAISSIRFDGKVPQSERGNVINRFRSDPQIRIMLLTLSCGAVGLTLTAASRAYLMEPHWNPTLEEQALARIHRIGQTKEVTTIRLYVRDSFEEQVIKLQTSKKQLANVVLAPHDNKPAGDEVATLQSLRALL